MRRATHVEGYVDAEELNGSFAGQKTIEADTVLAENQNQ